MLQPRLCMLAAILALLAVCSASTCSVANRTDCGYVGEQQPECLKKGCCWCGPPLQLWCSQSEGAF